MAPRKQKGPPKATPVTPIRQSNRTSFKKAKKSTPRELQGSLSKSPSTLTPSSKQVSCRKSTPITSHRQTPLAFSTKAKKSTSRQFRRSNSKSSLPSISSESHISRLTSSSSSMSIPLNAKNEIYLGGKNRLISDKVLMEIHALQLSVRDLIPKLSFSRLVREVVQQHGQYQLQAAAIQGLQSAAEMYLTQLFEDMNKCAMHARRITVEPRDMNLVLELTAKLDPILK